MLRQPSGAVGERDPAERAFQMRRLYFAWMVWVGSLPPLLALLVGLYLRFGPQNFGAMLALVGLCWATIFPGIGLWFAEYPAIVVTEEGLWGRDLWGRMCFSPWQSLRALRGSSFLGIAMICCPVPNSPWSAWIPRQVVQQRALERVLALWSPADHPIRACFSSEASHSRAASTGDERDGRGRSAFVARLAVVLNLLLYAFVLFLAASSYLRRHANPIWEVPENQPYLLCLDLFYSLGPALAALAAAAALIGRRWWAPLVALGVNSTLAALFGAGGAIAFIAAHGHGLDPVVPTGLIILAVLAVGGSTLVCSPAARRGFQPSPALRPGWGRRR